MATITQTTVDVGHTQIDLRRHVVELFIDNAGVAHRVSYLAPNGADHNAVAATHAATLVELLEELEYQKTVQIDAAPTFIYGTSGNFIAWLRARYKIATKSELAHLARWIIDRLDAGNVTITQLRNAFGLTLTQWNTLEAKMRSLRTNIIAVEAGAGE